MAIRALHEAVEADSPKPMGKLEDTAAIGAQLRDLRKAKRLTLQEVAEAAGISVSYLSQIERNVSRLPIGVLKKLADVLGVHMNWFFPGGSAGPAHERDLIVRGAHRRQLVFTGLGITEELLSPNLAGPLEMLISTIEPGADSEYYTHDGAEAGLVMSGTLELWVDEQHYRLSAGDSFAFPSTTPHRCANHGKKPVKVLWVITPPHY